MISFVARRVRVNLTTEGENTMGLKVRQTAARVIEMAAASAPAVAEDAKAFDADLARSAFAALIDVCEALSNEPRRESPAAARDDLLLFGKAANLALAALLPGVSPAAVMEVAQGLTMMLAASRLLLEQAEAEVVALDNDQ